MYDATRFGEWYVRNRCKGMLEIIKYRVPVDGLVISCKYRDIDLLTESLAYFDAIHMVSALLYRGVEPAVGDFSERVYDLFNRSRTMITICSACAVERVGKNSFVRLLNSDILRKLSAMLYTVAWD